MSIEAGLCLALTALLLGCAVASFIGAYGLFSDGDTTLGIAAVILGLFLCCLVGGGVLVYRYETGPSLTLIRAQWQCTQSQGDDEDGYVCVQYTRR